MPQSLIFLLLAQAVCRNSFQSLTKPDITRVELLRDVTSKQDLIVRLVAHDINDPYHRHHLYDPEDEERVLREDRSFFFNVPPPMSAQDEDKVSEVSKGVEKEEPAWHKLLGGGMSSALFQVSEASQGRASGGP